MTCIDEKSRPVSSVGRARTRLWPLHVAAFGATYTFSIGNVTAPAIAAGLAAGPGEVRLVLGGFAAAFASGLVLAGRIGDRVGRQRVFTVGLVALVVVSLLVACAPTIHLLIGARVLQGFAAALVLPQILGTIQAGTSGARRERGVALFAGASGVGTAAGQVIGGAIMSLDIAGTGWRGALGSIAVVFAGALAGARGIPATRSDRRERLDVAGAALLGVALLALIAGLSIGPGQGWPWWTVALVVGGVAGLGLFSRQQGRAERAGRPVLAPPSVLRLTPVWMGLGMATVFFAGYGAFSYELAVLTQDGLGQAPVVSGLTFLSFAVAFAVTSFRLDAVRRAWGERTMERAALVQGIALVLLVAVTVTARATGAMSAWSWWAQPALLLLGFAQAAQFGPLVSTVMAGVPGHAAGLTGGLVSTAQQAALGLGVAVLGGVFVAVSAASDMALGFAVAVALQVGAATVFGLLARRLRRTV